MHSFNSMGGTFSYTQTGTESANTPVILWAHGWGQNHAAFLPLIEPLARFGRHITFDLPGFGISPAPPENWGTADYADAIAAWIKENKLGPVLWVGHSFGCRVGVQLASRHPGCIRGLCLIAGAGLKRKRSIHKKIYFFCRIKLFKLLKHLVPTSKLKDKIMTAFGSADYKNAGAMRKIFVRVVNEDLSTQAQNIICPVTLIYGKNDTETPPEFGERFSSLISDAKLHLLDGQDHYSVLQDGRHPVIKILSDLMKDK